MNLWGGLIPGYPGEFTTTEEVRFLLSGSSTATTPQLDESQARWWADKVRGRRNFFPKEVVGTLSLGLPSFNHASIYGIDDVNQKFSVEIKCINTGDPAMHTGVTAHLDLNRKHLGIDLAHVEPGYRQRGTARGSF